MRALYFSLLLSSLPPPLRMLLLLLYYSALSGPAFDNSKHYVSSSLFSAAGHHDLLFHLTGAWRGLFLWSELPHYCHHRLEGNVSTDSKQHSFTCLISSLLINCSCARIKLATPTHCACSLFSRCSLETNKLKCWMVNQKFINNKMTQIHRQYTWNNNKQSVDLLSWLKLTPKKYVQVLSDADSVPRTAVITAAGRSQRRGEKIDFYLEFSKIFFIFSSFKNSNGGRPPFTKKAAGNTDAGLMG